MTITLPPRVNASLTPATKLGAKVPLSLAALLLPLIAWRRGRKQITLLVLLLAGFAGFSTMTGCGSGGYFAQPPVSYTVTITATGGGLTESETINLTVQ